MFKRKLSIIVSQSLNFSTLLLAVFPIHFVKRTGPFCSRGSLFWCSIRITTVATIIYWCESNIAKESLDRYKLGKIEHWVCSYSLFTINKDKTIVYISYCWRMTLHRMLSFSSDLMKGKGWLWSLIIWTSTGSPQLIIYVEILVTMVLTFTIGWVCDIAWSDQTKLPDFILIEFNNYCGPAFFQVTQNIFWCLLSTVNSHTMVRHANVCNFQ